MLFSTTPRTSSADMEVMLQGQREQWRHSRLWLDSKVTKQLHLFSDLVWKSLCDGKLQLTAACWQ